MKLKGISLNLPAQDLRIPLDPDSRYDFLSPYRAVPGTTYLVGFGLAGPRKLRTLWRPQETIYFDCRGAISLPDRLPDNAPATRVVRRLYVDDGPSLRFDLSIFANPRHAHPPSEGTFREWLKAYWQTEVPVRSGGKSTTLPIARAIDELFAKYCQVSTPRGRNSTIGPSALPPQIILLFTCEAQELARRVAQPLQVVNEEATISVAAETIRLPQYSRPICLTYLYHTPGQFRLPKHRKFAQLRFARTLCAWVYTDLELLQSLVAHGLKHPHHLPKLVPYLERAADGFATLRSAALEGGLRVSRLLYPYVNHTSRLIGSTEQLPLERPLKDKVVTILHSCQQDARRHRYIPRRSPSREPRSVFISYAHKDESLKNELEMHLSPFVRAGLIHQWSDRGIEPGQEWEKEINHHLVTADIILLLVSPDFIASDFCYTREVAAAIERHNQGRARVVPVILRPTEWEVTSLAGLQALPRDGKPVTTWSDPDLAFVEVVKGLRRVIESFTTS